uniref:Glycosyltransferase family 92 protein n=1 Tax=Caenorhabditis japonica TaxID=281687 RepID=A0A8R1HS59_CAEJA
MFIVSLTWVFVSFFPNEKESSPQINQTRVWLNESCPVEEWNLKSTDSFPFLDQYQKWAAQRLTGLGAFGGGQLRLISAFSYKEYIVVTTSSQDILFLGKPIFCRYYDCNRQELPQSSFQSFFFPLTAVHCARRANATYISLSFGASEPAPDAIPLLKRVFSKYPHEIGVCVGQIYGREHKWLQIIEFVEHHLLIGASIFYFTIFEMDGYTKKVIEDYQRLGLAEASFVNTEYSTINIFFQQIQLNECFFRSKFHSKWVINVDIDERLTILSESPDFALSNYLRNLPPNVCELIFGNRRVVKLEEGPETYQNEEELLRDMEFLRYNNTTEFHWVAPKIVFNPDRVHAIYMHWTWRQLPECRVVSIPVSFGYIRHYRFLNTIGPGRNWLWKYNLSSHFPLDPVFAEKLKLAVVKKVKYLYELKPIPCQKMDPFILKCYGNDALKCV